MTQTRTKPKKTKAPAASATTEVLTLAEAAAYLRVSEAEVIRLVRDQNLPGRLLGDEWRFLKPAIQDWLRAAAPQGSREAVLSVAGAWKDDPDLEAMVEEIYRRRGRPITEDGSYKLFHGLGSENESK